jgi:multidrug efflux pump subunit AcrB
MYDVIPNIIQTFLIAIEAMYLATLLIIPDLKSVIIIISTMGMILISLVATLHAWGIQASSVMMVELVMSVGFCSDFCVHIVHAFLTSTGTRKERAQQALINMGMPILCASLSSIIGIFFLGFAHSYLFRTFFITIVSIMVLGTIHALCFLPVILSLIGSNWSSHINNNKIEENNSMQMTSTINNDSQINEHIIEEYITKKNKLQRAPDTIEEEDYDLISSTTDKDETAIKNLNVYDGKM